MEGKENGMEEQREKESNLEFSTKTKNALILCKMKMP